MKAIGSTIFFVLLIFSTAQAQQQLTLEQCRARALESNKGLKQSLEKKNETNNLEKAALWQMLPKVSANGGYVWTEKSVNLLSDEQKDRINNLGNDVKQGIIDAAHEELSGYPLFGSTMENIIQSLLDNGHLTSSLNDVGADITDALETDTRNVGLVSVTLTQPIYMGGKLRALYRIAELTDRLSSIEYDKKREETLIAVDEAYWQVLSVKHKKELAQKYADLLEKLNENVNQMVEAEVATKGDLAKVRVKYNEAQMNLTKASNGLLLAKMLLAQRCGMPLDSDFDIAEIKPVLDNATEIIDMDSVWQHRHEMQMLRIGDSVAQQGVRIAASGLKPNIVATGGYMATNPNLFNGFRNEFGGTAMAGVAVNIPIFHPGAAYTLKAAKAKQRELSLQMEEAREMIELQVNKVKYELELSHKKLLQAQSNMQQAEENLKLADESFAEGMCSSSDLMAAQTAWVSAQGELLDAEIEIAMNQLYLRQAMGVR